MPGSLGLGAMTRGQIAITLLEKGQGSKDISVLGFELSGISVFSNLGIADR